MPVYDAEIRLDAARYARRYFARTITLDTFLRIFVDNGDPLIQALKDALVHEPRRDGLLGLRDRWWQTRYWSEVERLLIELEKGSVGEVPAERVYPRITLWGLIFGAAFLLWAGLFAARNLETLLSDLQHGPALTFWNTLWRAVLVASLGLVTAAGLEGWIYRLHLYRTRKISSGDR
jgi:hypothetical protein